MGRDVKGRDRRKGGGRREEAKRKVRATRRDEGRRKSSSFSASARLLKVKNIPKADQPNSPSSPPSLDSILLTKHIHKLGNSPPVRRRSFRQQNKHSSLILGFLLGFSEGRRRWRRRGRNPTCSEEEGREGEGLDEGGFGGGG